MKTFLNLENWNRKEHFKFFCTFDEPFFGVTANIDCTIAYKKCKQEKLSFYSFYMHKILCAANQIENFKYRVLNQQVAVHQRIDVSATVLRADNSFGFSLVEFHNNFEVFQKKLSTEIERVQATSGLFTREFSDDNVIHFSALPWTNFTSLSHARNFKLADSCPKISVGKVTLSGNETRTMPISVHVHHGLMDGYHVGKFLELLQVLLNQK